MKFNDSPRAPRMNGEKQTRLFIQQRLKMLDKQKLPLDVEWDRIEWDIEPDTEKPVFRSKTGELKESNILDAVQERLLNPKRPIKVKLENL